MSLSTMERSTWWRMKTFVAFFSGGPRKPDMMCLSGLLVMKNLTSGILETSWPRTKRMADSGSSSRHSSRASITIIVGTPVERRGSTINLCIWDRRDSCTASVSDRRIWIRQDLTVGYFCAGWNASVGKMRWRSLRSSTPLEQKNDAPRWPSAKIRSAIVCAMVDFPVPASPLSQNTGGTSNPLAQRSISFNTHSRGGCPLQATVPVSMLIPSSVSAAAAVEDRSFIYWPVSFYHEKVETAGPESCNGQSTIDTMSNKARGDSRSFCGSVHRSLFVELAGWRFSSAPRGDRKFTTDLVFCNGISKVLREFAYRLNVCIVFPVSN